MTTYNRFHDDNYIDALDDARAELEAELANPSPTPSATMRRWCPRCKTSYRAFPAVTRLNNKTYICPPCGVDEAMQDFAGVPLTQFLRIIDNEGE